MGKIVYDNKLILAGDLPSTFQLPRWNSATVLIFCKEPDVLYGLLTKVLLLRSSDRIDSETNQRYALAGRWGLLGERCEASDTDVLACAYRGIREEIQSGVPDALRTHHDLEFFGAYFFHNQQGDSSGSFVFVCETAYEFPIALSSEHDKSAWEIIASAMAIDLMRAHNKLLEDFFIYRGDRLSRDYALSMKKIREAEKKKNSL